MLAYNMIESVRQKNPKVLTAGSMTMVEKMNQVIHAAGGTAYHTLTVKDAKSIAEHVDALVISVEGLDESGLTAGLGAMKIASKRQIPVVLDLLNAAESSYRIKLARIILEKAPLVTVRGDIADFLAVFEEEIDNDVSLYQNNDEWVKKMSLHIARKLQVTTVISGVRAIICDGEIITTISNYADLLSHTYGTGAMLSALIAAFMPLMGYDPLTKASMACGAMAVGAEHVATCHPKAGPGTFGAHILDELYWLTSAILIKEIKLSEEV